MTDGDALYRAILADPADATARLVYADWLEETDDPDAAAFVRSQCDSRDRERLSEAEEQFLLRRGLDWLGLRPFTGRKLNRLAREWAVIRGDTACPPAVVLVGLRRDHHVLAHVRRGFVHRVACPLRGLARYGPALFAAQPVEEVGLADDVGDLFDDQGLLRQGLPHGWLEEYLAAPRPVDNAARKAWLEAAAARWARAAAPRWEAAGRPGRLCWRCGAAAAVGPERYCGVCRGQALFELVGGHRKA